MSGAKSDYGEERKESSEDTNAKFAVLKGREHIHKKIASFADEAEERLILLLGRFGILHLCRSSGLDEVNSASLMASLEPLRSKLAQVWRTGGRCPSTGHVANEICTTEIRAGLLEARVRAARDPCLPLCMWLFEGAPAGVTQGFEVLDGFLFPGLNLGPQLTGRNCCLTQVTL